MKKIFMILDGPLETDARVLRSLSAAKAAGCLVTIITANTQESFETPEDVKMINLPYLCVGGYKYLKFCLACIRNFFRMRKSIDVLYLHDYFSTFPGLLLLPFCKKKKVVYDAHELLLLREGDYANFRDNFFIWSEKMIVHKVDLIIEANEEREKVFKDYYHLNNTTNVLNITQFKGIERRSLTDQHVIVYQGTLTEERNLSFFIEAIEQIPDAKLLFIGGGRSMEHYKKMVQEKNLEDRVMFTGRLSNKEMMEKMKEGSIGIISYPFTNMNNIYCSPNKIFEYAAISLPFIATAQPFIKTVEEKYHIGRTFEFGNIQSFVDNVQEIFNHYDDYNQTEQFLNDYNYEKEFNKMVSIFETI